MIGNDFYDFLPGNGLYVDMDGSSTSAGKIVSKISFSFEASGNYVLQFDLAGAQSSDNVGNDYVVVRVGDGLLFDQTYSLETDDPFQTYNKTFHVGSATSAKISFEGISQDMRGMLLDNIILAYIPSPGAIVLGSVGVAIIGWLRRLRTL